MFLDPLDRRILEDSADDAFIQEAIELEMRAGQLMAVGGATDGDTGIKAMQCLFLATTIQKKLQTRELGDDDESWMREIDNLFPFLEDFNAKLSEKDFLVTPVLLTCPYCKAKVTTELRLKTVDDSTSSVINVDNIDNSCSAVEDIDQVKCPSCGGVSQRHLRSIQASNEGEMAVRMILSPLE